MEAVTAAKMKTVYEYPRRFFLDLMPIAKLIRKATQNGPEEGRPFSHHMMDANPRKTSAKTEAERYNLFFNLIIH